MLNYCQIDLARQVHNAMNVSNGNKNTLEDVITNALFAGRSFSQLTEAEKESVRTVNNWISEDISYIPQVNSDNLQMFFTNEKGAVDQETFVRVKQMAIERILKQIFQSPFYTGKNDNLNTLISSYIKSLRRGRKYTDISSAIKDYYEIRNSFLSGKVDTVRVVDYLLINHFPDIVTLWLPELITYNTDTNLYSYASVHDLDEDWTTEKEPELNTILQLLIRATKIIDFESDRNINYPLKPKDFIDSCIMMFKNMPESDYMKCIENPAYVIDYLIKIYFTNSTFKHDTFYGNFLKSFIRTWFYQPPILKGSSGEYIALGKYNKNKTGFGHHLFDIVVRSMTKYTSKEYIDYNLEGEHVIFNNEPNSYSKVYGQFCDYVNVLDINKGIYQTIFDEEGKVKNGVELSAIGKDLFGRYYDNGKTRSDFKYILLPAIYKFKHSEFENFQDFLNDPVNKEIKSTLLSEINYANRFNPYSVSGTVENAAKKPLPVTGLKNVAANIEECVYENRFHMTKVEKNYKKINETRKQNKEFELLTPISPAQHSIFKSHIKGALTKNLFAKTVYRSTIKKTIDNQEVIKEVGDMSTPEAFLLSFIEDFYKPWVNNKEVRFQAITPSDKPLIPFFAWNSGQLKNHYKWDALTGDNSNLENIALKEIENIYGQILLNSVIDFAYVLDLTDIKNIKADYTQIDLDILKSYVDLINSKIANISATDLQIKVREFNLKNGTNINLAEIHDFNKTKSGIQMNKFLVQTVDMFATKNIDHLYIRFLNSVANEVGVFNIDDEIFDAKSLLNNEQLTDNAKKSTLYTYFLLKMVLGESVLINTVGTHVSHKNNIESQDFNSADSQGHLTMVKRMVAMTATMHSMIGNVISGMPNEINTMTIPNETMEMFAYSGNSTEGDPFLSKFKSWDGAMISIGVTSRLLRQSTADTKPVGMAQKLLVHSYDPVKGAAVLLKMANFVIDNAFLRTFYNPEFALEFDYNPMNFMKMSLDNCIIIIDNEISINNDGKLIDYNRNKIGLVNLYFNINDIVYKVVDITFNKDTNKFEISYQNTVTDETTGREVDNNLFALWEGIGAQYSCDKQGNYNEGSQDFIFELINRLGTKLSDEVVYQSDVNQYLKTQMLHYFPTVEASKSLKTPVAVMKDAIYENKRPIYKVNSQHFGFQLDPDHEADDSTVKEITQLIGFIAEGMYVPEHTKKIYGNLKLLLDELSKKSFINSDLITDSEIRAQYRENLDRIFGEKMKRVFTDPNMNVIGLMNEVIRELVLLQTHLKVPYSDGQMVGKAHTSIGSEFNKYISRQWTGRGDVLVPSHNMAMIYEDEDGTIFLANDRKYNTDGSIQSAMEYLKNKVWADKASGKMNEDYSRKNIVSAYEVMPTDVYYYYTEDGWKTIVIETWEQLNRVRNQILNNEEIYVKAVDRPRNLRSKQVFLDVITNSGENKRIGMYHFRTMQEIALLGIRLNTKEAPSNAIELEQFNNILGTQYQLSEKLSDDVLNEILIKKRELQKHFENNILAAIANNNIEVVSNELSNIVLDGIKSFNYTFKEEERLTTNNYSSAFGIKNMTFAEIQQRKEEYFYEHLVQKFDKPTLKGFVPYDYMLFTNKGVPTAVVTDKSIIDNSSYFIPTLPRVNEDGYRIDKHGEKMYKWPNGAKLYIYKVDNFEVEVIFTDETTLPKILEDQSFVFYKKTSDKELPNLNARNLYLLNDDMSKNEAVFRRIAKKQYSSWLRSNMSVMARIPSQSLAFAMAIKTIGYLPYNNNITMVPASNTFLEGSDYKLL